MPYSYNWVNKGLLSKFLAPPGCSKSHQLVTISRHYRSHVGLKAAGGAIGKAYRRPHTSYRGGACNRQLPRILLPRTSVDKGERKAGYPRGPVPGLA